MSSRGYYYNKHPYRSRSYSGRKRIYGSAYQPGRTTKYQRYGRTMRLDPGYISIPRELPTRQSQLRQLEELKRAGLIPEPSPELFSLDLLQQGTENTIHLTDFISSALIANNAPAGRYIIYGGCTNGVSCDLSSSTQVQSPVLSYFIFDFNPLEPGNLIFISGLSYLFVFQQTSNNFFTQTTPPFQRVYCYDVAGAFTSFYLYPDSFVKSANSSTAEKRTAIYDFYIRQIQ